jgi:hypothetical protein
MAEKKVHNWDDVNLPDENVSDEDYGNAESSSDLPPGRYLAECIETRPIERQDNEGKYTYLAVSFKWQIIKSLEIRGTPVPENEQDLHEGAKIFDEVRLEHRLEKDGMKKRRHFVAKRLGLLTDTKKTISKSEWATVPVGKQMILSVEDQSYTKAGSTTPTVIHGKVKFAGYEIPAGAAQGGGDGFDAI